MGKDAEIGSIQNVAQGLLVSSLLVLQMLIIAEPANGQSSSSSSGSSSLGGSSPIQQRELIELDPEVEEFEEFNFDFGADLEDVPLLLPHGCFYDGRFVITGRGGLPEQPEDWQTAKLPTQWATYNPVTTPVELEMPLPQSGVPAWTEAQGISIKPDGTVLLIAHTTKSPTSFPPFNRGLCSAQ